MDLAGSQVEVEDRCVVDQRGLRAETGAGQLRHEMDGEEIATFCSTTYGVTFPMFEKIDVNGDDRHPVYAELTATPDDEGNAGDVQWNFEKFLVSPEGRVLRRFRPMTAPDDPAVVEAIEANLPG